MFLLAPWIAGVGATDVDILPHRGRALIFLSSRHARRLVIGADATGTPCIGIPFVDSRMFSTILWDRAIFALNCVRPPSPDRPGSPPRTGDFICLPGQERRNNGRFALWIPCRPNLLPAIIDMGTQFQSISSEGRGEARIGFYDLSSNSAEPNPEWLMGEDAAIVHLSVVKDVPCDGQVAWRATSAASGSRRKGRFSSKK